MPRLVPSILVLALRHTAHTHGVVLCPRSGHTLGPRMMLGLG